MTWNQRFLSIAVACALLPVSADGLASQRTAAGAAAVAPELRMVFVDVEGGQATLLVTPGRESLLIDTGWPGNEARDAKRIVRAAHHAGVRKLDYVLITHYHDDHVGGVAQLVARIPVGTFIDHGPNRETSDENTQRGWRAYQRILGRSFKRLIVKPGDALPLRDVDVSVISADGGLIDAAAGATSATNGLCTAAVSRYPIDQTENARSLGILITFGKLRVLDLGDLTADKEQQLMCPRNRLGSIDVFVVSHHGFDQSNSPLLIESIVPRLAIMDNGAHKGGSPSVIDTIHRVVGAQALWQLHYSQEGGSAHNANASHVANLPGTDAGHFLELRATRDGTVDIFNSRTRVTRHYPAP